MAMTKGDFIALADYLKDTKQYCEPFTNKQIEHLGNFCHSRNFRFKASRWTMYIMGLCGPNGGEVKQTNKCWACEANIPCAKHKQEGLGTHPPGGTKEPW
jgi:hypothetical protein